MSISEIESWKVADWHPDWGDSQVELEMLRSFCKRLVCEFSEVNVTLVDVEEGYIKVDIFLNEKKIAELYVVESEGKKMYALFDEDGGPEIPELRFDRFEDGFDWIKLFVKS